jgi:transposase
MLGELGDISSFQSVNQVYKLAGLNIIERSSGQFQSRRFISKDGRPMLRTHLFNVALRHCTHTDGAWYQWYTERKESKPAKVLFIASIRRLLRICYAVSCSGVGVFSSRLA